MRIAVSGRHAHAYIYEHCTQRIKCPNAVQDTTEVMWHIFELTSLSKFSFSVGTT